MKKFRNIVKYIIGFIVCFALRLMPFRPVNVEPIMATTMPFGKRWGWLAGGFFGAASIIIFDIIHPTPGFPSLGIWTLVTALMYGLVGAAAGLYLQKQKETKIRHYVGFAVIATLAYDFITGPIMSSIIWKMPFLVALIGQIPFTLWHLGGNVVFAVLLSPSLYHWVVDNKKLELNSLLARFRASA
jgi:hypothetical protein